jgi:hypothetical protein
MLRLQNKERILKIVKEKCQLIYKGKLRRIISVLSAESLKARKAYDEIFQVLKANNY